MRPRLALVAGEPAGIGPELIVRALRHEWDADLVIHGDANVLGRAADAIGLPLDLDRHGFVAIPHPVATRFGMPDAANAASVVEALEAAGQACLDRRLHGMVTGPVHKGAINAGGIPYTGTTGLLAAQAGCDVVMMLANPAMRVALLTTHLSLRDVPDAVTPAALERVLRIVHAGMPALFGIDAPRIAVLGLNPHAGEGGLLGREEIEVLAPVLARLRAQGLRLEGPLPADTAFLPGRLRDFDVVLAMYHDQGLPVLKHADFANAVNITLGLPYPRVAVDHGTALELAGTGRADPASLQAAIRACAGFARRRLQA